MEADIKIFISCHKPCVLPQDNLFIPIQAGAAIAKNRLDMTGDDTGDNISQKNRRYCELTVQYWAWKNVRADYVGFMHYRRFLCFAPDNRRSKIQYPKPDEAAFKKFGLDERSMRAVIEQNDVVMPKPDWSLIDNKLQYAHTRTQHSSDLKFCIKVIDSDFPEMSKLAHRYLHMHHNYYCNMFVMRKDIFDEYCAWLFHILERHEKECDCSHYVGEELRVSGFLAERLCAIYLMHLERTGKYKMKEVPRMMFLNTDPQ